MNKAKIIAVTGPTASGKTALAIELARIFYGEIISCDSMQIYKGMNIGTAKPNSAEKAAVEHHLIDIREPNESFSCAEYKMLCDEKITEITFRHKIPILCGGTGLYLDAVITGNRFSESDSSSDPALRAELMSLENDELYARLKAVDQTAAENIHANNKKRVARALEIFLTTGVTKTEWDRASRLDASYPYDAVVVMPDYEDRQLLYDRIDARVDMMFKEGLAEEAKALALDPNTTAGAAIGYKELDGYFGGLYSLDEAVEKIKRATRNYAKRQLTWFRRRPYITLVTVKSGDTFKDIVNNTLKVLTK